MRKKRDSTNLHHVHPDVQTNVVIQDSRQATPDLEAQKQLAQINTHDTQFTSTPSRVNSGVKGENEDPHQNALQYAIVALLAFILGIILVSLQIYGLHAAIRGWHAEEFTVKWCSPTFLDFAVAVTTGNCKKYEVFDSSSKGIGCIALPGTQQRNWLLGTAICLSVALFGQTADVVLMMCAGKTKKWRGLSVQRPWCTIWGGVIMLVVLVAFGCFNADNLPRDVTRAVWIYRKEPSRATGRVCQGTLNAPGLRGVMIGYMDGLFDSWGSVYDGRS